MLKDILNNIIINYLTYIIIVIISFLICFFILNIDIIVSLIISLCSFLVAKYIKYPVKYIYDYISHIKFKRYNYKQLYNENKQKLDILYGIVQCVFCGLSNEHKTIIIDHLKYANKFLPNDATIYNYPIFKNDSYRAEELSINDLVYYDKIAKEHEYCLLQFDPLLKFYLLTGKTYLRKKDYRKLLDSVKNSKLYKLYYKN